LKDYIYDLNLNIICRVLLGNKFVEKTQETVITLGEFKKMMDEFFFLNNSLLNIGDLIPWINFLDLQGYVKRMKSLGEKFDRVLEHVLDEHYERRKGVEDYIVKDIMDVFLNLAEDSTLEVKLKRHGIKAFTQVCAIILFLKYCSS